MGQCFFYEESIYEISKPCLKFGTDTQTDRWTDGWTDGWTDVMDGWTSQKQHAPSNVSKLGALKVSRYYEKDFKIITLFTLLRET